MNKKEISNLGDALRQWRKAHHLNQYRAADRIGICRQTVGRCERGERMLSVTLAIIKSFLETH